MWKISNKTQNDDLKHVGQTLQAYEVLLRRQDVGFLQLGRRQQLWDSVAARAREIRRQWHHLVVVGMGGSSLGSRALIQALKKWETAHEISFIDNNDAEYFWKWIRAQKNLQDFHWLFISKSGNTIETLTIAEFVDQHLRASGYKKMSSQCTVISENKENPLANWARREGVPLLEVPVDVGGRYSVLSPVGLLPGAYYGLEIDKMQKGLTWALTQRDLVCQLAAQALMSFERQEWMTLLWPYSQSLKDFGFWMQQLWAESLAKSVTRSGQPGPRVSTPVACMGAADQHSILQQVMEGARDKFICFFRVEQSETFGPALERNLFEGQQLLLEKSMGALYSAEAEATREALQSQKVNSLTLSTSSLNEESIAALFMLMQLVVATMGEVLNVDAFNQPGVELGKRLARDMLLKSR